MPILRLVIIAVVVWFAMRVVRRLLRATSASKTEVGYRGKMVTCEICGVYLPEHDAVCAADGKYRCDKH